MQRIPGSCDGARTPVHRPVAIGRNGWSRSIGMPGRDRYTQVEVERAPHAIPGRAGRALSLQLSVVSGAPVESLRDVSLRRRVHRIARALKSANNQVVHRKLLSNRCGNGPLSRSPPPQHSTPKTWSSKTSSSGSVATATSMRSPRGTQVSETITSVAIFNAFAFLRCRFWSFGVLEFSPAPTKTADKIGSLTARKVELTPFYFPNPTIFIVQRLTPPYRCDG